MDIEWATDGRTGELFIVQARPGDGAFTHRPAGARALSPPRHRARSSSPGKSVGSQVATGPRAGDPVAGRALVAFQRRGDPGRAHDRSRLGAGAQARAAAVVTDEGGRTCHAAIVSRELGIPCVVGTANATARPADRDSWSRCRAPRATTAGSTTGASTFDRGDDRSGDAAGPAGAADAQRGQPRSRLPARPAAERRRRARADRVRRLELDRRPSDGAAPPGARRRSGGGRADPGAGREPPRRRRSSSSSGSRAASPRSRRPSTRAR